MNFLEFLQVSKDIYVNEFEILIDTFFGFEAEFFFYFLVACYNDFRR